MHAVTRRLATAAGLLITATVTLASPPPAQAALAVVSPGEEVDYINPSGGNQFCTIGYVYTGADLHTYAITAAHCRSNPASGYARDKRSGLTGNFVRTIFESPRSGGADYALIDFHTNSIASALIDANHTLFTDDHPEPQIGETVCRIGVSSGQHCGQIAASQGQDQYLTTGMPPSIPGDSGGPVWTPTAQGYARIVGIWLGEKTTAAGQEYGRFGSLASGLRALNAPDRPGQNLSNPE
ncbi:MULTISPECIES: serine protease [Mycobacterium avium complex (MAC)]|mgnify:CR=1 FL=1|uniref:serine protease n=1 Tax=Mycobacterium avium complex (MAC) TaxID=120793 RepID=UPI00041A906F|nr:MULTISPECIES: serine protease [Mycobacterium avium complex (MAC)]MBG0730330.1 serine protease [Mycobacterium avium]